MHASLKTATDLVRKVYALARPYGLKRLALVTALSLAQGVCQVIGVTSIFPFLALAADPARLRNSEFGRHFLELLPPMDNTRLLFAAGILAVVMLFVSNGVNILSEYVRTRYAHNFGHWLRVGLLRNIASRPYADFLQENSAVLTKKIVGDVMQYTTGVLLPLLDSIARGVTIVLLVATLFLVHPTIALVSSLGLTLFYLIVFRVFGRWRALASHGLILAQRGVHREAHQLFSGIKPVKVHGVEEHFVDRFSVHSRSQARLMAKSTVLGNAPRYMIEPLAFSALVAAVLWYAARGQDLSAILPNLGVMALAGYRLLPAMQLIYAQLTSLSTMKGSLDELYPEFASLEKSHASLPSRPPIAPAPSQNGDWHHAIHCEALTYHHAGAPRPAIQDLTVSIPKNSSLGVSGPTGSGKSTFVDLFLGLLTPSGGRILLDGDPLTPETTAAWRRHIGYVPQDIFLIDDTVTANIAFGVPAQEVSRERLRKAAGQACILEFIENHLPLQWDTVVGERGIRLSGGQRQRIGLARALYGNPSLLVLDEATSALDYETEKEVMDTIRGLSRDLTLVIVAHRLETIADCTHQLRLAPGGSVVTPSPL